MTAPRHIPPIEPSCDDPMCSWCWPIEICPTCGEMGTLPSGVTCTTCDGSQVVPLERTTNCALEAAADAEHRQECRNDDLRYDMDREREGRP